MTVVVQIKSDTNFNAVKCQEFLDFPTQKPGKLPSVTIRIHVRDGKIAPNFFASEITPQSIHLLDYRGIKLH